MQLDADSEPQQLMMCARFFMENNQHEKATRLLLLAKMFDEVSCT